MPESTVPPPDSGTQAATPAEEAAARARSAAELPPGYEYVRDLGRGGMGVVVLARQTRLQRDAAVKLLLAGEHASADARIRFVTEGEAVARVRHPNVVQVFEAGTHAGQPYLAMEYLPGGPLSAKLDDGPLPPADAAALLEPIARGVAACHAAGLLHRDIKPANILLDADGSSKVADFGLAKLPTLGLTATAAVFGSPSYMAPEQAVGAKNIGPAADVYSLGATLYELLTGRPPFQGPTPVDTLRQVLDADPLPPRALQPTVPRDLETVCLKCLEKRPDRRYPSAAELADELERWRTGRSIVARPAGPIERSAKWVRRNRVVTAAAAAVFVALAAGTVVSLWQAAEARAAQKRAEEQARLADAVTAFLEGVLLQADAEEQVGAVARADLTVKEAVAAAAAGIADRFAESPLTEARVRGVIGLVYTRLGAHAEAEPHLSAAHDIHDRVNGPDHPDTIHALASLALLDKQRQQLDAAERRYLEIVARRRRVQGDRHRDTLRAIDSLACVSSDKGDWAAAESRFSEALDGLRATVGSADPDTLGVLNNYAHLHLVRGDHATAARLFAECRDARRAALGAAHPVTLRVTANLATTLSEAGRYPEADALFAELSAGFRTAYGDRHPLTLMQLGNRAALEERRGDYPAAVRTHEEVIAGWRALYGDAHRETKRAENKLANVYRLQGRLDLAEPLYVSALAYFRAADGDAHPDTLMLMNNLAAVYNDTRRLALAEPLLREVVAVRTARLGPDHPDTLTTLNNLGYNRLQSGQRAEAIDLFRRAADGRVARFGADHPEALAVRSNLAVALQLDGRLAEAVEQHEQLLAVRRVKLPADHPETLGTLNNLSAALLDLGRFDRAAAVLAELHPACLRVHGPNHPQTANTVNRLGVLAVERNDLPAAERHFREALRVRERAMPKDWGTAGTRAGLGRVLLALGRPTEAEPLLTDGYTGLSAVRSNLPPYALPLLRQTAQSILELYDRSGQSATASEWRAKLTADLREPAPSPRRVPTPTPATGQHGR